MFTKITTALTLIAAAAAAPAPPAAAPAVPAASGGGGISITPHDVYGSSIGVLGCKVNVNRIAYWPTFPGCDNLCKKVTVGDRSVYLLHIDQSGGAHDISYDAWNYLKTGKSALEQPDMGGGIAATWQDVSMDFCKDIIKTPDGKLPLSAANSMGTWAGCPAGSYVHDKSSLWNILNPNACTFGYNEQCTVDLAVSNQPKCAHILGANNALTGTPVENIAYGTKTVAKAIQ